MIKKYFWKQNLNILFIAVLGLAVVFAFYVLNWSAPNPFSEGTVVRIESGETLSDVAVKFENERVVRSGQWLSNFVVLLEGQSGVIAGDYFFREPQGVFGVAKRITSGDFGIELIKVTIPEGLTREETADILKANLPNFNKERFLGLTGDLEGRLFPETYFFPPTVSEEIVVERFLRSFDDHISLIATDVANFHRPFEDVLIMASILEEEATTQEDRRKVSGLLWKRLDIGMPLQVDASFLAINGKTSAELTREDLTIDSPFNTYRYRGLPPTPISSPGLDSIMAALNPIETEYLYYLSEDDGTIHYASDLKGHNENKNKFLSD